MILELAILNVRRGRAAEFEQAFREAQRTISSMVGYVSHELQRCLEVENKYVLLVCWRRLGDHTEGFRKSAEYQNGSACSIISTTRFRRLSTMSRWMA